MDHDHDDYDKYADNESIMDDEVDDVVNETTMMTTRNMMDDDGDDEDKDDEDNDDDGGILFLFIALSPYDTNCQRTYAFQFCLAAFYPT